MGQSTTKGYVSYTGSNVFGKKTLYSFRLSNEDKFFGCGEWDPGLKKNDYVEFEYTSANGRHNVAVSSIKHVDLAGPGSDTNQGSAAAMVQSFPKKSGGSYWDSQERIDRDKANDTYRKAN